MASKSNNNASIPNSIACLFNCNRNKYIDQTNYFKIVMFITKNPFRLIYLLVEPYYGL